MQRIYTSTAAAWLVAVIGFGALAGCGQRGALYLPNKTPAAQSATDAPSATGQSVPAQDKQKKPASLKPQDSAD